MAYDGFYRQNGGLEMWNIDWEKIDWERLWKEKIREQRRVRHCDIDCWNRTAGDYAEWVRASDYAYGRKVVEFLKREEMLKSEFEVLDIGAGPGSISIPLAEVVKRVVAVEPSSEMVKHFIKDAAERGLRNIEVINKKWEEVDISALEGKFDLVIASRVIGVFEDIGDFITRMSRVSRKYCCIAVGFRRHWESDLYKELKIPFWHTFDHFIYVYNILYKRGIVANVKVIDYTVKLPVESAIRRFERRLSRYRELTDEDKRVIRDYVLKNSKNGIFERREKTALMCWQKGEET